MAAATPPSRRRGLRRALSGAGIVFAALVVVLAAGLAWLGTESGLRFVVGKARDAASAGGSRLSIDGASGSLYTGVRIDRFSWSGGGIDAAGTGLVARWSLPMLLERRVRIPELSLATLAVRLPAPAAAPAPRTATPMPGSFALPVTVDLQRFAIGDLQLTPGAQAGAPAPETIAVRGVGGRLDYGQGRYRLADLTATTPYGRIDGGRIEVGDAAPHPILADLAAAGTVDRFAYALRLAATGDLARLSASADGTVADATLRVDAVAEPLSAQPLVSAQAAFGQVDLRRLLATGNGTAAPPQTLIDGTLALTHEPVTGRWHADVGLRNARGGSLSGGRLPVDGITTRITLVNPADPVARTLQFRDLRVTLPGPALAGGRQAGQGVITGTLDVTPGRTVTVAGIPIPDVRAALVLDTIDLARFGPPASPALPATALGGTVSLTGDAFRIELNQSAERMRALLPAVLVDAAGAAEVLVRGRLDDALLRLDEGRIRLGASEVRAAGEAGVKAPFRVRLQGDVRRIELGQWLPRDPGIDPRWRNGRISGEWSVDGTVAPAFDASVALKLTDSTLAGRPLDAELQTRLVLAADGLPVRLERTAAEVRLGSNRIRAAGALGAPADRMTLDLALPDPGLFDPRLGGRIALDGELTGTFDRLLARATVRGDALRFTQPDGDLRVASIRLEARVPAAASVPPRAPLAVTLQLRDVRAAGRTVERADLKVDGSLEGHRFELSGAGEGQSLVLRGNGQATLTGPPSWRARLDTATLDGSVPIRLTAPAELRVDGGSVLVDRFAAAIAGGEANLVRLLVDWTGQPRFDSRGTARDLPITRLIELAGGADPGLDALRALRVDADWALRGTGPEDLSGEARIGLREATDTGAPLGLSGDANGVRVVLKGGRLDGRFDLTLPSLAFTHRLTAPDLVIDGRLKLAGAVAGTLLKPQWDAMLTGEALSVLQRSVGWRLTDGALAARFEGRSVQLQTLKLNAGDGSIQLKGRADLLDAPRPGVARRPAAAVTRTPATADPKRAAAPDTPSTLPFDGRFELTATRFQVPIGPGQRVALSGTTELASGADGLSLRGRLRADHGIIEIQGSAAPGLPSDVVVVDARPEARAAADAAAGGKSGPAIRILTDLAVDLGDRLRVTGNGIAARLTGNLRVLGMLPDDPRLTGVVNIVDGSYQAYGQDLKIEKGAIRFNGPIDNPALDLLAKRPFLPVEVGVAITGTALSPKIALVSTPEMAETDKLSWLVLGVDPKDAPSAAQTLALRQAASTLLARDDGRYRAGIAERLGLDVLNFGYGSDAGPAQGVRETMAPTGLPGSQGGSAAAAQQEVVTLGKRIGSRLFVSYEQGVRGLWNLLRIQYTLTRRVSVRAQTGSDNAVDLLYAYPFD